MCNSFEDFFTKKVANNKKGRVAKQTLPGKKGISPLKQKESTDKYCDFGLRHTQQISGGKTNLQPTNPGTDKDVGIVLACMVYIGGKMFLHSDGRATSSDISRERKQLLHGDHLTFLIPRDLGSQLQVNSGITRDDAHEIACTIALQH